MTETALPATRFTQDDFSVGRVIGKAGSIFWQNFMRFVPVTATTSLLSFPIEAFVAAHAAGNSIADFLSLSLEFILFMAGQALIMPGAVAALRGEPVHLVPSFGHGLRRLLPVTGLAISFLAALGGLIAGVYAVGTSAYYYFPASPFSIASSIMVASILFYVVGLMLAVTLFVAVPVCVIEELGPFRSMGRSAALTKGCRRRIFALALLVSVPAVLVMGVIGGSASVAKLEPIAARLLPAIWDALWAAFFATLLAATYHDLRVVKEGIDLEGLPAVFD